MIMRRLFSDRHGMTMIELCIVIVILGILMVTGVAALLRARMASNEGAAIAGLRATVSAQFAYLSGCGAGSYATSYLILGTKPSPNNQGYISPDLGAAAVPQLSGYTFRLQLGLDGAPGPNQDCNGNPTWTSYYASAVPNVAGQNQANGTTPPPEPFGPGSQLAQ
jgi:prepilin-type N-terminal cleavage/methylation domain-containing protein